jgi:hypothetical protein
VDAAKLETMLMRAINQKGKRWPYLMVGKKEAVLTRVFSGGTCNIMTEKGLVRNPDRDTLNNVLDVLGIPFFDPQISMETHGREYDSDQDGEAERRARGVAEVVIYQVSPYTPAGVSLMEILQDTITSKKVIVIFTGDQDAKGTPSYTPQHGPVGDTPPNILAYLEEIQKTNVNTRKHLLKVIKNFNNTRVLFSPTSHDLRQIFDSMKE